jgi:sucrose phosphatase-like protein
MFVFFMLQYAYNFFGHLMNTINPSNVEDYVLNVGENYFGIGKLEKIIAKPIGTGLHNHNFRVDIYGTNKKRKRVILRIPASSEHIANKIPEFEFEKLKLLGESGIAPQPIAFLKDTPIGQYVIIMECFIGEHKDFQTLTDEEIATFARTIAVLHDKMPSSSYSLGMGLPPTKTGNHTEYIKTITENDILHPYSRVKSCLSNADQNLITMAIEKLSKLLASRKEIFNGETYSLLHGDLNPGNVLWTPDGVRLVDWEDSYYGDRANEVAYIFAINNVSEHFANIFLQEYGKNSTDAVLGKRLPIYLLFNKLFDVVWAAGKLTDAKNGQDSRGDVPYYSEAYRVRLESLQEHLSEVSIKTITQNNRLFVGDLDETLLGDNKTLGELHDELQKNHPLLLFAVATGRSIASAKQAIAENFPIMPDLLITSVGTEIYRNGTLDMEYAAYLRKDWNPGEIRKILDSFPGLTLQEEENQGEFHISYYSGKERFSLVDVRHALKDAHCNIIYSHNKYLDILPAVASKGHAVSYLSRTLGINTDDIVVAGDSGNDEEMITAGFKGIVVGNFTDDLEKLRGQENIYFAKGEYARGVLEGLKHFHFI